MGHAMTSQIVLITGARGDLGRPVTQAFLDAGSQVVGTSRNIDDSAFASPRFTGIPADLTRPPDAASLVETVIGRFHRIDALVHVAGGFAGSGPIQSIDDAIWDAMMNLNLRAAFYILRAVIPHMRRAKLGRIVAIGSRAGIEPAPGIAAYAASKAALVSLIKSAALENRDAGITANIVLPGTISTEANRLADPGGDHARWVSPQKLAALVYYLTSEAASEITGAAIPVYGAGL
jgi:NAD(P)-dependent dehydrogenase (short-subunit alcohol dehydrogenase family)